MLKKILQFFVIFITSIILIDVFLSIFFEKEIFLSLSQKFNLVEKNKSLLQPAFELNNLKYNNSQIPYWKDDYRSEVSKNTYIEGKNYNCSVLGLGDSIMAGFGVSHYNKTYFYNLSKKVPNTKWVNFGTPGYSLLQEMISYSEFENPKNINLLIWHLWIDDDFIYKLKDGVLYNASVLLNESGKPYLFSFIPDNLNNFLIKNSYLYNEILKIKMKSEIKKIENDDYLMQGLDNFLKNYFSLGTDKKVLFIFSPPLREKNLYEKRNPNFLNSFYNNIKNNFQNNKNIYFMDLGNYLNGVNFEEIKNKDNCDCHFNDEGHKIVAEKLYDFIKTNKLLDEKCY